MINDALYDINAETGVLCSLIQNPNLMTYSDALLPNYFYKKENGVIYWAIQQLWQNSSDKIDEFNITMQVNSNESCKNIINSFDKNFIQTLVEKAGYVARDNKEEYKNLANIVISLNFKRELYNKLTTFTNECLKKQVGFDEINLSIRNEIDDLASRYITQDKIPMYNQMVYQIWDRIVSRRDPETGVYGLPSKFEVFKPYFTYQPGELVIVAARRKNGKSVFGMNELMHMLKKGIPCVLLDTEMNNDLWTTRALSYLTKIEENRIKSGSYSASEELMIKDALDWLHHQNFERVYDPQWTMDKVYTTARVLKNKMNFQFLIHDYIKITDEKTISTSEQYNILGNWCNLLKNDIAGGLDVPVLSFAQLNRFDKIADSDKIERYASTGIKWSKKTPKEIQSDGAQCGNYKANIMFNRLGDDMDEDEYIDFVFDKKSLSIDVSKQQHKEKVPDFMKSK